jgi:hypothetical protein
VNKYDFTNLVKSPKTIGEADMEKLKGLVNQFPYFSVAQNLLVKALHNTHHYEYEKFLKQAALQAGNRSVLYNLVHDLPLETESDIQLNQSVETLQFQNNVDFKELAEKTEAALPEPENTEALPIVEVPANSITPVEIEVPSVVEKPIIEVPTWVSNVSEVLSNDADEKSMEVIPAALNADPFNDDDFAAKLADAAHPIEPVRNNLIEEATPIVSSIPETPVAKAIVIQEPEKDPNIIYEDEKLVRPVGDFEKFIPKTFELGVDDEFDSLITLDDDSDDVLGNFDISSLNSFVPARPIPEEDELVEHLEVQAIEPMVKNVEDANTPLSLLQEVVSVENNLENKVAPIEEKIESQINLESKPTEEPAGADFFKWLSQKEEVALTIEETINPDLVETIVETSIPREETIQSDLGASVLDKTKELELSHSIEASVEPLTEELLGSTEVTVPAVELAIPESSTMVELPKPVLEAPMVEDEVFVFDFKSAISQQANSKLSDTIQEHLEKPIPVKEVRFEQTLEQVPELPQSKVANPLQSLLDYEVNEYLAPLYKQVSYNEHLFENAFIDTYGGTSKAEFNFVRLKPLEDAIEPLENKVIEIQAPIEEKVAAPIEQIVELSQDKKTELSREDIQKLANQYHISEEIEGGKEEKKTVLSREEIQKLANQYHISEEIEGSKEEKNKEENREIEKAKKESLVQPKMAELPTPKIARDPGTVESILDKFIRENPSIARPKSEFYSPVNMAKQSAEESAEIVSETLAQIYTRQGLYKKAIVMYEKLGLHYPDKFTYFAGLISQIKSAHNIE